MQSLNAQSRALLMQKLDRTGIASRFVYSSYNIFISLFIHVIVLFDHFYSIAGTLGVPALNGSASNQRAASLPMNGQAAVAAPVLPANVLPVELVGTPSECLLLKNLFDPATEVCDFFSVVLTF